MADVSWDTLYTLITVMYIYHIVWATDGVINYVAHTHVHTNMRNFLLVHSLRSVLTTGGYSLPKQVLHGVRASASSCNFQHPIFSLRSSSSCLLLLLRPPVTWSITCIKRQILRKILTNPVSLSFFTVCKVFLSSVTQFMFSRTTKRRCGLFHCNGLLIF